MINIKFHDEGENLRLTWSWPQGIEHLYISDGIIEKLYTLQEYKQRGGYFTKKKPGKTRYYIKISEAENSPEIFHERNENSNVYIFETVINIRLIKKHKNHEIILSSKHDAPPDTICYKVSGLNNFYFISERLEAGKLLKLNIRTEKNQNIHMFINEEQEDLYSLHMFQK